SDGDVMELAEAGGARQRVAPSRREVKGAVVADAASIRLERDTIHVFTHPDAKGQVYVELERMVRRVDVDELEPQLQPQYPRPGFPVDFLPDRRRAFRLDGGDAQVEHLAPSGRRRQKPPHHLDRSID